MADVRISDLIEVTNPTIDDAFIEIETASGSGCATAKNLTALGWGRYNDNMLTALAPLVVNNARVLLTNNAATSSVVELPEGVDDFWDSDDNKITPENDGDFYLVTIQGSAVWTNSTTKYATFEFNAGGVILQHQIPIAFASSSAPAHFNLTVPLAVTPSMVSNGVSIYVDTRTPVANLSLYGVDITITRIFAAK